MSHFNMQNCPPGDTSMRKEDKFSLLQCPMTYLYKKEMQIILYASSIRSLMYAQVCTYSDITYIVGMLCRHLSNPYLNHGKQVMRYLYRIPNYKLIYWRIDRLEIMRYSDSDFAKCVDSEISIFGYIFVIAGDENV